MNGQLDQVNRQKYVYLYVSINKYMCVYVYSGTQQPFTSSPLLLTGRHRQGGIKKRRCVIDKGDVNDKAWFFMQNVST